MASRTPELELEILRVSEIWATSSEAWLFGEFSAADVMFAPVAARFRTYDVVLEGPARRYGERLLAHPLCAEWFELGEKEPMVIEQFELPERRP